jgi:drug/metabolite transporter (DMT)-like permease
MAMSRAEWTLLLLLSVLWGGSFFFSKVAVADMPPLTIVFVRFAVAALLLYVYLRANSVAIPTDIRSWTSFAGMGLLNNLTPAGLIVWGQTKIPSGLASVIIATTPIFSMLAIHFTSADEKLDAAKFTGMALGLFGVCVLLRLDATDTQSVPATGIIACLGAAISYGCANALGKRFRTLGIPPTVGAMGQMAATACMALPLMVAFDAPWRHTVLTAEVWASLAGLAILSTALGYVVFFRILASAGATNISLVTLLIPVSAVLLGSVVLGERLSTTQLVGMLLIASGLMTIDGRAPALARYWVTSRLRGHKFL